MFMIFDFPNTPDGTLLFDNHIVRKGMVVVDFSDRPITSHDGYNPFIRKMGFYGGVLRENNNPVIEPIKEVVPKTPKIKREVAESEPVVPVTSSVEIIEDM